MHKSEKHQFAARISVQYVERRGLHLDYRPRSITTNQRLVRRIVAKQNASTVNIAIPIRSGFCDQDHRGVSRGQVGQTLITRRHQSLPYLNLRLAQQHGRVSTEGIRLNLTLSQTEFGSYVGLSRENVSRQLRWLREANVVKDLRGATARFARAILCRRIGAKRPADMPASVQPRNTIDPLSTPLRALRQNKLLLILRKSFKGSLNFSVCLGVSFFQNEQVTCVRPSSSIDRRPFRVHTYGPTIAILCWIWRLTKAPRGWALCKHFGRPRHNLCDTFSICAHRVAGFFSGHIGVQVFRQE